MDGPSTGGARVLRAVALSAVTAVLAAGSAWAQQWQIRPNVNLDLRYDDNVRSVAAEKQGSFVTNARAAVRAIRRTEASDVGLAAGFNISRYSDVSDLNNTSGFVSLNTALDAERNLYRFDARFDSESTLTSEVATSGFNQVNKQRNQWRLSPRWTYLVSERASIDLGLTYANVSYSDVGLVPLYNYWTGTASIGGGYRVNERGGLTARLEYGRYEAQDVIGSKYDNIGAQLGADYLLSETLSLGVLVGWRQTDASFAGPGGESISATSGGPTYIINLAKRLENGGNLNLRAARELAPSGNGRVLDNTSLNFGLNYPLSERWRFGFSVNGHLNRSPSGDRTSSDNRNITAVPRISYELTPTWSLAAGYEYSWQSRQTGSSAAQSNTVFLTLAWTRPWDL